VEHTEIVGRQSFLQRTGQREEQRWAAAGGGQHHRIHSFLAKDAFFLGNNEGGLLLRLGAFLK
jgi:hypothetical protein